MSVVVTCPPPVATTTTTTMSSSSSSSLLVPLTRTTWTCTIPSYSSIEYLLIHTVALITEQDVFMKYNIVDSSSSSPTSTTTLQEETFHKFTNVTKTTFAYGLLGAIRLLAKTSLTFSLSMKQESWLESVFFTLYPILQQKQQQQQAQKQQQEEEGMFHLIFWKPTNKKIQTQFCFFCFQYIPSSLISFFLFKL